MLLEFLIEDIKKLTLQKIKNMSDTVLCPKCSSEFTYPSDNMMVCSQCFYEWNPEEAQMHQMKENLDSNGNELQDGDSVVVIKDLP
jgi:protein PhnA